MARVLPSLGLIGMAAFFVSCEPPPELCDVDADCTNQRVCLSGECFDRSGDGDVDGESGDGDKESGEVDVTGDSDGGGEECQSSGVSCRHPEHLRSIDAVRFSGETYQAGCPDGSTFTPLEYSEVFTLCEEKSHYYSQQIRNCLEEDYLAIAEVRPREQCPAGYFGVNVLVSGYGGCEHARVDCTWADDGGVRIEVRQDRGDDFRIFNFDVEDRSGGLLTIEYDVSFQVELLD